MEESIKAELKSIDSVKIVLSNIELDKIWSNKNGYYKQFFLWISIIPINISSMMTLDLQHPSSSTV